MNWNDFNLDMIAGVFTIIGVLFTIIIKYALKEKVKVTVYCTENTLLTQKPEIPGLTFFVQYKDTMQIENLWKICCTLKNTGNKSIIGEGNQSSLVTKGLPLCMKNVKQIIQISATDNSVAELQDNVLHFKQWRPEECITIEALVESSGEKPDLYIDGRDIINAEVIIKNNI